MYTVRLTEEFQNWLDELNDKRAQLRVVARLRQAEAGNLGDWAPVGDSVFEMRLHFGQATVCTSLDGEASSSLCSPEAISRHRHGTSGGRNVSSPRSEIPHE